MLVDYLILANTTTLFSVGISGIIRSINGSGRASICIGSKCSRLRTICMKGRVRGLSGIRSTAFLSGRSTVGRCGSALNSSLFTRVRKEGGLPSSFVMIVGSLSGCSSAITRVGGVSNISDVDGRHRLTGGLASVDGLIGVVYVTIIYTLAVVSVFVVTGAVHTAVCSQEFRVDVVGSINTAGSFMQ